MWHKAPCSSRDYSGVRESGPREIDEDGDDDGDVDEDDHRGDDSPPDVSGLDFRDFNFHKMALVLTSPRITVS